MCASIELYIYIYIYIHIYTCAFVHLCEWSCLDWLLSHLLTCCSTRKCKLKITVEYIRLLLVPVSVLAMTPLISRVCMYICICMCILLDVFARLRTIMIKQALLENVFVRLSCNNHAHVTIRACIVICLHDHDCCEGMYTCVCLNVHIRTTIPTALAYCGLQNKWNCESSDVCFQ